MLKTEWYRRTTWTDSDREEFNSRLGRSRSAFNKAQYLRIQASHLAEAGLQVPAIELLDRMFEQFPEKSQVAAAHEQRAKCLASIGQTSQAINEYRAALQAERDFPNVRTDAWLSLGWLVIEHGMTDLYDEVLSVLREFETDSMPFPITRYRYLTIQALIADSYGNNVEARDFASGAISEAARDHSGFQYHAKLGLVVSPPAWIAKKLSALAGM